MNKKIFETLEFDKIKALFAPYLMTAQGRIVLSRLRVLTDRARIQRVFDELSELRALNTVRGGLQLLKTADISEILKRLGLDASLSAEEFLALKIFVSGSVRLQQYFDDLLATEYPALSDLVDKLADLSPLEKTLAVFDESGQLLDTASSELARIRSARKRDEAALKRLMQDLLSKRASDLAENLITVRDGRPVLPVKAEAKSRVSGTVHDLSSSGQTVYIEPAAAVTLNNGLNQLQLEERNEIARILAQLTEKLRPHEGAFRQNAWLIGLVDLLQAKLAYMKVQQASIPELSELKDIRLLGARHPLLEAKTAVANDIKFDESLNTIVITGPNTGGKTITLKTLGLLTLMAQAGLPIPVAVGSQIAIFDEIFADIGDEQSIEHSLSTFSGHMTQIIEILKSATAESLVLLDELGAGTDPKEGAALALTVLEELRHRAVKTMATTHYPELKFYGLETEGVMNASMVFDIDHMRPTYRLNLGVPGSSNAIEISRRLGLPEELAIAAQSLLSAKEHTIGHMIQRLEDMTREVEESMDRAHTLERENESLQSSLSAELSDLVRHKSQLTAAAQKEAAAISAQARSEAQNILKNLNDKMTLKPHEVISAMAELDTLAPKLAENKVLKKAKAQRGLKAGAEVLVTDYGQRGRLVRLEKNGNWTISMGAATVRLPESAFELIASVEDPAPKSKAIKRKVTSNLKAQLDLRGTRYEEASLELDAYIDQALLANLGQITIVHGIGTGVIRDLVQQKLARHKHIKSFAYAPINAGGSGATIALLK